MFRLPVPSRPPPASLTTPATLVGALGLGLALYLAALKLFSLPCLGGAGCGAVIHSRYGTLLGVPVGLYAAALWFVAFFAGPRAALRTRALLLLAVGSVGFVAIQAFVLHRFCAWCLAHSVATWLALALHRAAPKGWLAATAGVLLALGGYFATRHATLAALPPAASTTTASLRSTLLAATPSAAWLGPVAPDSPVLVLSLTCPKCLDLLDDLTRQSYAQRPHGPALYLRSTASDRELTMAFAAAVAAQGDTLDAFLSVTGLLLSQKELILGNPAGAATWLRAIFPADDRQSAAAALVDRHATALAATGIAATPLLLPRSGALLTDFSAAELFPPAP